MSVPLPAPATPPSNGALIRRLLGLTWRYRRGCIKVLSIQLVLLTMGLLGLSLTGLGIDYISHEVQGGPFPQAKFGLTLPHDWPPVHVIALLAGIILVLALCRALLNAPSAPHKDAVIGGRDRKPKERERKPCPVCKSGHMLLIRIFPPAHPIPAPHQHSP